MALRRHMPRLWPRHVPRFCPWQTLWYQPWQPMEVRGNCHGNFRGRQTTAIFTAICGHPRPLPRQSSDTPQLPRKPAAIATAISADVKPQQFPRPSAVIVTAIFRYAAIATEVRGNCHGNFRGSQTTAISTTIRGNPPIQGNCHGNPRQLPRKSTAIATAISTAFRGHPRQLNCHVNRRQFPCNHGRCNGNPRSFPRQATGCHGDHGKARPVESLPTNALLVCLTKNESKRSTWYTCVGTIFKTWNRRKEFGQQGSK